MSTIFILLRRDLLATMHRRATWVEPFVFFTIVMILFPLAADVGQWPSAGVVSAVLWVSVLLANFLALERLLRPDFDDGSLEQWLLAPYPPALVVLSKILTHWLAVSLPLVILAPFYALLVLPSGYAPAAALGVTMSALALGTLTVNLIGVTGAALVVTLHRSNLLSGLLVMPLYIPVLVFGAHATAAAAVGLDGSGPLAMLGAMLILALILAPVAAVAALRVSLD